MKISPDDLAYLIYTNGSIGKPKGVMLTHGGAANYFTNNPVSTMIQGFVDNAKCLVGITTLSFDMSIDEIGKPLFNGLIFVLADENQTKNSDALLELIERTNVDSMTATPSRLLAYLEYEKFVEAFKNFKSIVIGGEKFSPILLEKLRKLTSAQILNGYGSTETTIATNAKDMTNTNEISVGLSFFNMTEFVADSDGNELLSGIVGKLYIGGAGVAKSYNNLPEKTSERFIDFNGVGVYKSGDYARWTSAGDFEILARTDNQIKLRGLRIELGEVESAMSKVPAIKNVIFKIVKINGNDHLCAYFTADETINIDALKTELGKTLPQYMVPTAYLQLKKMPMTLNGKIDTKALTAAQIFRSAAAVKGANKIEADFYKIFGEVLELEDVGAEENFFDLGGTSLLVTRIVIMAQKLGYKVSFANVFANKTPRTLAALQKVETATDIDKEISNFDYAKLQSILDANNLESFKRGEREPFGNIILTGATGYLGIHILHEFLENHAGKVYCLLRGKKIYRHVKAARFLQRSLRRNYFAKALLTNCSPKIFRNSP